MNAAPSSASPTLQPGMLQTIAQAICDRPEDTAAQRAGRFGAVMATVQKLQPCGAVEVMLAGMAVTHAYLIEDAARDVCRGQDDRLKARTRSSIAALGRGMRGFLQELRTIQAQRLETAVATSVTVADPVADAGPVEPSGNAPEVAVEPKTLITTAKPPAYPRPPEQPVPWPSPLRRSETSVAAMMAVLSPPMPSYPVSRPADQPVAASPAAGRTMSSAPDTSAGGAEILAA
jgi:hypothetical protein